MNRTARHMSPLTWNTPREADREAVARAAAESFVPAVHPGQADIPAPYTLAPRGRHAAYDRFFPSEAVAPATPARQPLWRRVLVILNRGDWTTHSEPDEWDMLTARTRA